MKLDAPVTGGPCWTELGTSDLDAARRFYTRLFGWRPETDARQEAGGYTVAHLGDAAVAALAPLYQPSQPVAWNVSFAVTDADATVRAVTEAGGTLLLGPMDVFDVGRFAVAADPGGAVFQLWQAGTFPGAGLFNAPGSLGWVELMTRDPEGAVTSTRGCSAGRGSVGPLHPVRHRRRGLRRHGDDGREVPARGPGRTGCRTSPSPTSTHTAVVQRHGTVLMCPPPFPTGRASRCSGTRRGRCSACTGRATRAETAGCDRGGCCDLR